MVAADERVVKPGIDSANRANLCGWARFCGSLGFRDSHGKNVGSANLQKNAGQRSRRRSLQDRPVRDGKHAVVTGAYEGIFVGMIEDGAGIVRADAAASDVSRLAGAHQDARSHIRRILKDLRTVNGNLVRLRDHARGSRLRTVPLSERKQAPDNDGPDRGDNRFPEATPRDLRWLLRFRTAGSSALHSPLP